MAPPSSKTPAEIVRIYLTISLPRLSPVGTEVIGVLSCAGGYFTSSHALARAVGLRNRHQLSYVLQRDGLPPLQALAGWIRIMVWVVQCEQEGMSLCRLTLNDARDPACGYRLVKRLTGCEWRVVRDRGSTWLLRRFLSTCPASADAIRVEETGS
jgi:hypothetical protein